jgi:hypothetical protein
MLRAELVADFLKTVRLAATEKAVVEAFEGEPVMAHLLLGPLVAIEAELDGIRQVGADLQEGGPPVLVLQVEVVMVDEGWLAREIEANAALWPAALLCLERPHFLLGYADEHDAFVVIELRAVLGGDVILALTALELHDRDVVAIGEVIDGSDERVVHRTQERRRRDGVTQVLLEEVAELSGRLQPRKVAVDVEPIDAGDRQRDVIADNLVDVGHGSSFRRESAMLSRQRGGAGPSGPAPNAL